MTRPSASCSVVLIGMAALFAWHSGASLGFAGDRYALIVSGAAGGPPYETNYERWRSALVTALREQLGFPADHLTVLGERAAPDVAVASRENVRRAISTLGGRIGKDDLLLVVLIGHGTFDGTEAKFNLVGPDFEASDWNQLLKGIPGRVAVINTASSSFPFIERLAAPGRIVVTATDSVAQRYDTIFPDSFVTAVQDPSADLDKNGRISLWEAFAFASDGVRHWYEQRGQLSTERPLIDDNGDGIGKEAGAPGPDGALARQIYLDGETGPATTVDPGLAELLRRRAELETQVETLKARKNRMPADVYEAELEKVLTELAKVSRQIRSRS